jgi:hypothetical protein
MLTNVFNILSSLTNKATASHVGAAVLGPASLTVLQDRFDTSTLGVGMTKQIFEKLENFCYKSTEPFPPALKNPYL